MNGLRSTLPAALPGALLAAAALVVSLPSDPAPGVTFSGSPWTDEGWSLLGARNLSLLGTWATDELQTYLVQLPFHVALLGVFEAFGVGIVQARALSAVVSVAAVILVAVLVALRFGRVAGAVAGTALAGSSLFLFHGRLAELEPMVAFLLCAGAAALLTPSGERWMLAGVLGGTCLALAIGTKPSAVAAVVGMLAGAALAARLGARAEVRHLGVAAAIIILAGAGWALLIALPNRDAIETAFRFWPPQPIPEAPLDWVIRMGRYVRASDGANTLALPLYLAAGVGVVLSWRRWASLAVERRMLIGAAIGWVVLGLLVIVLTAYRPNRYVVPLLPALAILGGAGVSLLAEKLRIVGTRRLVAGVAVAALLALPGAVLWTRWMTHATYLLPEIQQEVAEMIGTSAAAEGGTAPALAMRAPVRTIVPRPAIGMNDGDLYATHGVRWIVADETYQPTWAPLHPDAWAARETIRCWQWGEDENECLIRVP